MAFLSAPSITPFLLLASQIFALQVTPNSPCASVCLDDQKTDVSDPDSSNTYGKDIVCRDSDSWTTAVGEKFEFCVSCLQTSTYSGSKESDQDWFLYNIRYALDTCLFGFASASDPISTPCSTDDSCGQLQKGLEDGDLDPTGGSYGYCSADGNAFLGSYHDKCHDCLQVSNDTKYLANFLTALKAGCVQQPMTGTLIGIQGSVFSPTEVNITYPGYNQSSTSSKKKGLSQSAIIGVSVTGGILLAVALSVIFVCYRKHRDRKRMKRLGSPLNPRFGAMNITSPNNGSYGNPYASPPITVNEPFDPSTLSLKERKVLGLDRPAASRKLSVAGSQTSSSNGGQETNPQRSNQLPPYSGPAMPTHQAYVPGSVADSRVTSIDSDYTFQLSTYSSPHTSPRTSPKNKAPPPLPIKVPRSERGYVPIHIESSEVQTQVPSEGHTTPSPPYVPVDTRLAPRSVSRSESRRQTSGVGLGNSNASTVSPSDISGPLAPHGRRYDFELAERDRHERDLLEQRAQRKKADVSSDSVNSQEQWPGTY